MTVFIETGDGRDPVSSHPVHPPCCCCRIVLRVHFPGPPPNSFWNILLSRWGSVFLMYISRNNCDGHSHLFFTPFPLHLLCSHIPENTGTSYSVILKCFFSLLSFFKRICAVGQGYSGRYKQPKQYHLSSYLLSNPGISCPGEYEKPKQKLEGICWIPKQKHTENIVSLLITAKHTLLQILFCYNVSATNFLLKMLFITIVSPLFVVQSLHLCDL